jgi:hypothetical protein
MFFYSIKQNSAGIFSLHYGLEKAAVFIFQEDKVKLIAASNILISFQNIKRYKNHLMPKCISVSSSV